MNTEQGYVYNRPVNRKLLARKLIYSSVFLCHHFFACCYGLSIIISNYDSEIDLLMQTSVYSPAYGTNWNFLFQTTFLTLSLLYDVLEWLEKHESELAQKLRYLRDIVFCGMVFPYTLFISSMFWTLFLIDRELVFPEIYDLVIPWWLNHCIHTNIVIVIIIETLIQARRQSIDRKVELSLVAAIGILYAIVYYSVYFFANRWLYMVFGILTWWQICIYQLVIWGSCFVFYFIQFPINRLFHKEEVHNFPVPTTEAQENTGIHGAIKESEKNGNVEDAALNLEKSKSFGYQFMKSEFENSSL